MTAGAAPAQVSTAVQWLVIEPLDTVTVRDGRAFDAGQRSLAGGTQPAPSTVAGAVAQVVRGDPRQVHGPLVVRRAPDGGQWEPLFPIPADVVRARDEMSCSLLEPTAAPAAGRERTAPLTDLPAGMTTLSGDGGPVSGWWTAATLHTYLTDRSALRESLRDDRFGRAEDAPWAPERRVGLARTGDRTAQDGLLYSAEQLRPRYRAGFAARCLDIPLPPAGSATAASTTALAPTGRATVRFGGEGRRAEVHRLTPNECASLAPPTAPADFPDGRVLLYLATPALFADGWRPGPGPFRPGVRLIAAATGSRVISTARPDHALGAVGGARLLWAAAAGSVYFLQADSSADAAAFARGCHDQLLTAGSPFPQIDDRLVTAGFGLALIGRW